VAGGVSDFGFAPALRAGRYVFGLFDTEIVWPVGFSMRSVPITNPEVEVPSVQLYGSDSSEVSSTPDAKFEIDVLVFPEVHSSATLKMPSTVHVTDQPGFAPPVCGKKSFRV
jgi:hypothetical protein